MGIIIWVVALQFVVAIIVLIVLKGLFNKELNKQAIEHLASVDLGKKNSDITEIVITSFKIIKGKQLKQLHAITAHTFPQAKLVFKQDISIKGGMVIRFAEYTLDHSLRAKMKGMV